MYRTFAIGLEVNKTGNSGSVEVDGNQVAHAECLNYAPVTTSFYDLRVAVYTRVKFNPVKDQNAPDFKKIEAQLVGGVFIAERNEPVMHWHTTDEARAKVHNHIKIHAVVEGYNQPDEEKAKELVNKKIEQLIAQFELLVNPQAVVATQAATA